MDIIVIRGAGDNPGDDIVEPLLYTDEAGISRGRAELDERGTAQQEVNMLIKYRVGIRLGQLAEVVDTFAGMSWKGKITKIEHIASDGTITTKLRLTRPTDFY